jgi:tetratricopeptide (TPR) repeat protein
MRTSPMRATSLCWLSLLALAGCHSGKLADPNELGDGNLYSGEILERNIRDLYLTLDERVVSTEITQEQRDRLFAEAVASWLKPVNPNIVPSDEAHYYADAYRTAGDWETAEKLYRVAAKSAQTPDRLVNDTLRLAWAEAKLGKVQEAIATARKTFDAPPREKAPILMSVLYELAPAAEGKGHDGALAKLIEDATAQHAAAVVDPSDPSGKAFLIARRMHLTRAWQAAVRLYEAAGMKQESQAAAAKGEAQVRGIRSL